ncbi:RING-H2 finger protein ATL18-like [Melia azedarach]|uniref:RING-H2 finger protein ATL18-like n=1 Tax=Melia azedarach TaxID=155640 RepID=A0ACC1XXV9_MELAZ|nr:RING-H2 finger protein ATL18-like [Melia azedarach]
MICLVHSESSISTAVIAFFICVMMSLLELKRGILRMLSFIFLKYQAEESSQIAAYLSTSRFEDLDKYCSSGSGNKVEEMCSICLMEFEKEDVVSRLIRCGHVFHRDCIERWLDCYQFTCPLCRSFFLINVKSCHAKCDNYISHTQLQLQFSYI